MSCQRRRSDTGGALLLAVFQQSSSSSVKKMGYPGNPAPWVVLDTTSSGPSHQPNPTSSFPTVSIGCKSAAYRSEGRELRHFPSQRHKIVMLSHRPRRSAQVPFLKAFERRSRGFGEYRSWCRRSAGGMLVIDLPHSAGKGRGKLRDMLLSRFEYVPPGPCLPVCCG